MACLHLLREDLACAIYVDTGYTYRETQRLVDYAATMVPMYVVHSDRAGQNERDGIPADIVPLDWTVLGQQMTSPKPVTIQSYLGCCWANIAAPLFEQAKTLGVTELVYGQRNQETHKSPARHGTLVCGITRLHPIEDWTDQQVMDFLKTKMEIPAHYAIRHSSLDCYDCPAFHHESSDRVAWTKEHYPKFYDAYRVRKLAIESALVEAYSGLS